MKIDRDAFEEWSAHPITELLFKCCVRWAEEAKADWVATSWAGEKADSLYLARMRERANAFEQLKAITAESIEETLE